MRASWEADVGPAHEKLAGAGGGCRNCREGQGGRALEASAWWCCSWVLEREEGREWDWKMGMSRPCTYRSLWSRPCMYPHPWVVCREDENFLGG